MEVFVTKLNQLLQENKISMYKLAKDLNVSKQAVIYWCKGINEPKISYIRQLALYFDVTSDYLLGLEDDTGTKTVISNSFNNFNNSGNFKL